MLETICIMCPMGCPLKIVESNGEIAVSGNTCPRGAVYGKQEYSQPKRVVTTLIKTVEGDIVSCKTAQPVAKQDINEVLSAAKNAKVKRPVKIGDVLVKNADGKGAVLVATKQLL